jgi:hypothetical protein
LVQKSIFENWHNAKILKILKNSRREDTTRTTTQTTMTMAAGSGQRRRRRRPIIHDDILTAVPLPRRRITAAGRRRLGASAPSIRKIRTTTTTQDPMTMENMVANIAQTTTKTKNLPGLISYSLIYFLVSDIITVAEHATQYFIFLDRGDWMEYMCKFPSVEIVHATSHFLLRWWF